MRQRTAPMFDPPGRPRPLGGSPAGAITLGLVMAVGGFAGLGLFLIAAAVIR